MDDDGLTWDRNRTRSEQPLPEDTAQAPVLGPGAPVPEPPGQPPDDLAACHAVLADRIASRRKSWSERKPHSTAPKGPSSAELAARAAFREKLEADRRAAERQREQQRAAVEAVLSEYDRPRTRADCAGGPRPCPWASCRFHLLLEVTPDTGRIVLQERELEDLPETCALDVADRGALNQPDTAALLGVTRQRVDQLEKRGIRLLALRADRLR